LSYSGLVRGPTCAYGLRTSPSSRPHTHTPRIRRLLPDAHPAAMLGLMCLHSSALPAGAARADRAFDRPQASARPQPVRAPALSAWIGFHPTAMTNGFSQWLSISRGSETHTVARRQLTNLYVYQLTCKRFSRSDRTQEPLPFTGPMIRSPSSIGELLTHRPPKAAIHPSGPVRGEGSLSYLRVVLHTATASQRSRRCHARSLCAPARGFPDPEPRHNQRQGSSREAPRTRKLRCFHPQAVP